MSNDPTPVQQPAIESSRFGYFLMQTHVAGLGPSTLVRLTVEDLTSGEKRVFASTGELSQFLNRLLEPPGNERWAPRRDA